MDVKSQALVLPGMLAFRRGAIVFYSDNLPMDVLTRLASGSYWTHVTVALGDGKAIGARGNGVGLFGDYLQTPGLDARMYPGNVEAFITRLQAQTGKPYDYLGLLGNPVWNFFRGSIGSGPPKRFHCSSLVAYCWETAVWGRKPLRAVTPQDIWNLLR